MHSYVGNLPSGACFDASKDLADTEWIKIWLAELKRLNPNEKNFINSASFKRKLYATAKIHSTAYLP